MTVKVVNPLIRSELEAAGITRRRCGPGFRFLGPDSAPVTAADRKRAQGLRKGGRRREQAIADTATRSVVRALKYRRWGDGELLAYSSEAGAHDVSAADVNAFLQESAGAPLNGHRRAIAGVAREVAGSSMDRPFDVRKGLPARSVIPAFSLLLPPMSAGVTVTPPPELPWLPLSRDGEVNPR